MEKDAKSPTATILFHPISLLLNKNHTSKNRIIVSITSVKTSDEMNLCTYAMLADINLDYELVLKMFKIFQIKEF